MLLIVVDGLALVILLQTIIDEEPAFLKPCLIAFLAGSGTTILANSMMVSLGVPGLIIAALIGAALTGLAIAMVYGAKMKRSLAIGGIFAVIHLAAAFGIRLLVTTT